MNSQSATEEPTLDRLWIVTGATGFLGQAVVRELVARGRRVRACEHGVFGDLPLADVDCERVQLDVTDAASTFAAFSVPAHTPVTVVHCAGIVSIAGKVRPQVRLVNVGGTQHVLDACRRIGDLRLVYVSTVHASAESQAGITAETYRFSEEDVIGEYAKTKAEASRRVLQADDLDRVIVQPSGIYGPGDPGDSHLTRLIRNLASGRLKAIVAGGYDLVDVRDVAAGVVEAAERGRRGEPYILSGYHVTISEVAGCISELTGRPRPKVVLPIWIARLVAPLLEAVDKLRGSTPLFTSYSLHVLGSPSAFSHARASQELGYQPRPMAETLSDTIAWLRAIGGPCRSPQALAR